MIVLATDDLGINFGGIRAVHDVSITVAAGERRAIIGPNGAGKTTLFNLIGGQLKPSAGEIRLLGQKVHGLVARQRAYLGLSRTFQITRLFPSLTVIETMLIGVLGTEPGKLSFIRSPGAQPAARDRARALLAEWCLSDYENHYVGELSYGTQRQLEIALALALSPKVLLLDEPTAGLSIAERDLVVNQLGRLDPNLTVLLTEHDMDVVFGIATHITVLDHGEVVVEGPPAEVRRNPRVHEIYFSD
ncbi:MAG: ABC transporter ATP-binding protein [Pseudorhodoplanes sp.]